MIVIVIVIVIVIMIMIIIITKIIIMEGMGRKNHYMVNLKERLNTRELSKHGAGCVAKRVKQ